MQLHDSRSHSVERFLSGAYKRIQWITVALGVLSSVVVALVLGWRGGLGAMIGAVVGYLNLVWLHHGAAMMVERMLASADKAGSRFRLMLSFVGRYVFLMAIAYAILKSFPSMLKGFTVALFLPVVAATCEGVYEAIVNVKAEETPDETILH